MKSGGFVSLVGAGPGNPDLLTVRAVDRLRRADLVLYDALVEASVLDLAGRARRFYVGKRAGRAATQQRTIEALMIRHAKDGLRVVRLKAGDPFVFGRGGEEALALEEAAVPYEVVPGLSSAVAAPALAGIPVTHRGASSAFMVISGHSERAFGPVVDALPPQSATLVFLMGFEKRRLIADRLGLAGWTADTPVALIAGAGTRRQKLWTLQLGALAGADIDPRGAPVTMVVGATASLTDVLPGLTRNQPPETSVSSDGGFQAASGMFG